MQFRTTLQLEGKTATGFQVPADVVEAMGKGKRPPVTVTINGYTYRSTVAAFGEVFMLPLAAEHRVAAGVAAGDEIEVDLELDERRATSRSRPTSARRSTPSQPPGPPSMASPTATRSGTSSTSRAPRPRRHASAGSRSPSRRCARASLADPRRPAAIDRGAAAQLGADVSRAAR